MMGTSMRQTGRAENIVFVVLWETKRQTHFSRLVQLMLKDPESLMRTNMTDMISFQDKK